MTTTLSYRGITQFERINLDPGQLKSLELAQELNQISDKVSKRLIFDGVDASDALRALTAGILGGDTECLNGTSQAGLHKTIERLYREASIVTPLCRYSYLNSFGFQGRAVYAPVDFTRRTNTGIEFLADRLFEDHNSVGSYTHQLKRGYVKNYTCRESDFDETIRHIRGQFILERMAQYEATVEDVNSEINKYGEIAPKGVDYARFLVRVFNSYGEEAFCDLFTNHLSRANVWFIKPLQREDIVVPSNVIEALTENELENFWENPARVWDVITSSYQKANELTKV